MNQMRLFTLTKDHTITETISLALQVGWPGMEVIAGEDIRASCLFRDIKPEVVVIDLDLPDAQGFRLAKDIRDW